MVSFNEHAVFQSENIRIDDLFHIYLAPFVNFRNIGPVKRDLNAIRYSRLPG